MRKWPLLIGLAATSPGLANYGPPTLAEPHELPFVLFADYVVDLAFLLIGLALVAASRHLTVGAILKLAFGVMVIGAVADAVGIAVGPVVDLVARSVMPGGHADVGHRGFEPASEPSQLVTVWAAIIAGDALLLSHAARLPRRAAIAVAVLIALGTAPYFHLLGASTSALNSDRARDLLFHGGLTGVFGGVPDWVPATTAAVALVVDVILLSRRLPATARRAWLAWAALVAGSAGGALLAPGLHHARAEQRFGAAVRALERAGRAVMLFKQVRGRYPESLDELVPGFATEATLTDPTPTPAGELERFQYRRPCPDEPEWLAVPLLFGGGLVHPALGLAFFSDGEVHGYDRAAGWKPALLLRE